MKQHRALALTTFMTLAGAIVLAAGSPSALAQSSDHDTLQGSYNQPLSKKARRVAPGGDSATMIVSESDGNDSYSLRIENDNISAEVNGKKVPEDRVRRTGDTVEILGKDGQVIHTFNIGYSKNMGAWGGPQGMQRQPRTPVPPAPPAAPDAESAPPPVMLGLLMNDSEDQDGIVVEKVFDDMPAAKAGLKEGDVIVKFDGKGVDEPSDLREVLLQKKPGDKVEVHFRRDGNDKTITLELAPFDQNRLKAAREKEAPQATTRSFNIPGMTAWNNEQDWTAEAKKAIESALEQMKGTEQLSQEWKEKLSDSLEKALAGIEKSSGELRLKVQNWREPGAQGGNRRGMMLGDNPDHVFVMPTPAPRAGADTNDKLDRLANQLDRLNRRLEDLEKRLDKKQP